MMKYDTNTFRMTYFATDGTPLPFFGRRFCLLEFEKIVTSLGGDLWML